MIQKILIKSVTGSRNFQAVGQVGYIQGILKDVKTGLPVFMTMFASGRILPIHQDYEDFVFLDTCGNCGEEVDASTLSDDYYQECLECVEWFQERMLQVTNNQGKTTSDMVKIAMANSKKATPKLW